MRAGYSHGIPSHLSVLTDGSYSRYGRIIISQGSERDVVSDSFMILKKKIFMAFLHSKLYISNDMLGRILSI